MMTRFASPLVASGGDPSAEQQQFVDHLDATATRTTDAGGPHGFTASDSGADASNAIFAGVHMRRVSLVPPQQQAVHHMEHINTASTTASGRQQPPLTNDSYVAMFEGSEGAASHRAWAPQPREVNLAFGNDVIQVPLKIERTNNEYINLVLSHREFDIMAVHIPKYDEMPPAELVQDITLRLKEQQDKQKNKRHTYNNQLGEFPDSTATFQARILELEYELSRFKTKLAAARALQTTLTDENTMLRSNLREMEQRCVENETLRMQNDVLREQSVTAFAENAKLKRVLLASQLQLRQLQQDVRGLRTQVHFEQSELAAAADHTLHRVLATVRDREHVLEESYQAEKRERQLIAEKYYELSGRIRVFCRLRPVTRSVSEENNVALVQPRPNAVLVERSGKEFVFDQVFGPDATQQDVYAQLEPLVVSFADGFNACIMAYGQTGSGKTHTMVGGASGEAQGMIPRALQQVFAMVDARRVTYRDELRVTMVEIYNDQVVDLLGGGKLKSETDVASRRVTLWEHVTAVLAEGNANRNIAATSMNLESSRSHALVFLHLASQHRASLETRHSTLCLVDLAGSERLSRSLVEGERLKETQHINKSLAALGDVMHALQHKAKHVPYRNAKLTYMLREMLAGTAKTLLLLQLSPELDDVDESICSLQFGARVSQIQMGAVKPSVEAGEIVRLREDKAALERKMRELAGSHEDELAALHLKLQRSVEREEAEEEKEEKEETLADSPPSPSARSVRSTASSTRSTRSTPSTAVTNPSTATTATARPAVSRLASLARPSPRAKEAAATPTLTPATAARVARRQSLTTLSAPSATAVLSARERLARAGNEPTNRRATLGAIGSSSSSPSLLSSAGSSSRVPRPRAVDDSAAVASPPPSSAASSSIARPSPVMRRTSSLATPRAATASSKTATASTATKAPSSSSSSASSATPAEKRRSLGSSRALPSSTASARAKAAVKTA